ncbi:MAG TPA: glycosyltransferase family A protein [Chitinophagaceae bacterium]|nr:glycosyltransferase family A protein [Chitinophagaceae bacterium]HNM67786.1 glycosyltransferase family A protein [Chitinophagales bacterium]
MSEILFSIVVPTYNRAHLITSTIESLTKQDYTNFEIIIVDDGSTDNTAEVIAPFLSDARISYYKKNNAERAAARNYGATKAKGEYVNFFDSDDIALPNHLKVANQLVQEKNNPEWFHLAYSWAETDLTIKKHFNNFKGDTLNSIICNGNPLSCNGVLLRKDIALQYPFNEERILSASEDYNLWIRLAARFPLYYSNEITTIVIEHDARSVKIMNAQKLIDRLDVFMSTIKADEQVRNTFLDKINKIQMYADLYIAVHLATTPKYKITSIKYLFKTIFTDISVLKLKAFYATLKNIIIKW